MLNWILLAEVTGRYLAELIQSKLNANDIAVELFQESVGHHIYPTTVDGLARVQIFVPKDKLSVAKELLAGFSMDEPTTNESS